MVWWEGWQEVGGRRMQGMGGVGMRAGAWACHILLVWRE